MSSVAKGLMIISEGAQLIGEVRNCTRLEVSGTIEGRLTADNIIVQRGGRIIGTIRSKNAEVHGEFEGTAHVSNLLQISETGSVTGTINYHHLAMAAGGTLAASVRNVPPRISGDLELTVVRNTSVKIEPVDLTAFDPDDTPDNLKFSVVAARNGHVAFASAPQTATTVFTEAELEAGSVMFTHDGAAGNAASFDVIVADAAGATSGAPKTVRVIVVDR